MDDFTEKIEDEKRIRRREEIARMRKEKQLQMKRRRRMKILLTRGVGVFVISLLLTFSVITLKNKSGNKLEAEEQRKESTSWFSFGKETEDVASDKVVPEEIESAEDDTIKEEENIPKEIEVYKFTSTSETASIWNEKIISSNAILIDENTDTIIASKGAKERISPASMTKVLTILVAAEHLTKEQMEGTFVMTREVTDYGYINDCSSVGFLEGEEIPVRDLFYGTILPSGCDAAVGLATYVAGSHEAFVELMNEKLKELELAESSHMTNCVGIYDTEHYSTVYDMAVIMKAAIKNEWCKEVLSKHRYTTTATIQHPEGIDISNWFLRRIEDKDTGGVVLCAKTGYVQQSKNCAVSYGTFANGKAYICVTAGSSSSWRCIYDHVDIYNQYIS